MKTTTDFTVGDVVRFLAPATPGTVGWAAPAGALARVVGIDMTWWHGCLIVEWLDPAHGQNAGGYRPECFEASRPLDPTPPGPPVVEGVQVDLFEMEDA